MVKYINLSIIHTKNMVKHKNYFMILERIMVDGR